MSTKTIDTLLQDIDAIFTNPNHKVSDDNLKKFTEDLSKTIKSAIEKSGKTRDTGLRMSNLGTKDRKLYLDIKNPEKGGISPALEQRFLYGHVVEALLVFLIREAGHTVAHEQEEVSINGVPGHSDLSIDGVVTDLKSASPYQFFKFSSTRSLKENDTFGYITQLGGYHQALRERDGVDKDRAAILVQNKSDSDKRLLLFDDMDMPNIPARVDHVKAMLDSPVIPPICHTPEVDAKTGNSELAKGCKWCRHKFGCFPTLRAFKYANGTKYLTSVISTPRVEEIKIEKAKEEVAEEIFSFED